MAMRIVKEGDEEDEEDLFGNIFIIYPRLLLLFDVIICCTPICY